MDFFVGQDRFRSTFKERKALERGTAHPDPPSLLPSAQMAPVRQKKSASPIDDLSRPDQNSEANKLKRKRQSQSCDACRARKVKCTRDDPDDSRQSCKHCISLGIPCTYDYQPKKRGPPNLYLRRLQEAAAAAAAAKQDGDGPIIQHGSPPSPQAIISPVVPSVPSAPQSAVTNNYSLSPTSPSITGPLPPSRYPIAADSFQPFQNLQPPSLSSFNSHQNGNGLSLPTPNTDVFSPPEFGSFSMGNQQWNAYNNQPQTSSWSLPPNVIPPLSYCYRPHRLEDVAPRDTISLIIALFFDFVYPLTPCIHKPSFMADLHARREERDPLFFALVMSTVASTLVQVPRSYVPLDRAAVRKLAQTCSEASRHITVVSYDPPTTMHAVIRYLDCVYHFCEGHDATQHAAFGEASHIAITLRMHEEAAYEGLDPIESEIRRRVFWLLFDADKSESILLGRPISLRDEDCTVHFPKELDDEYITSSAYLPQPVGKTSLVSGLNYISRIFALLGEILVRIRVDKRSPPRGPFATARLEEVETLHARIIGALAHAPEPLRLTATPAPTAQQEFGAGYAQATFAEVKDFFDNPKASRANALNPFLVMQANIYVTQQLVRFVIEQYRDELLLSMHGTLDETRVQQDREAIASELLNILHSIPIQSIATNGPSLVHKVRFVASTLLDAARKPATAERAERANAYLWDFLSILSEIERNYLLDDSGDATSSAEGMATL